MAERSADLSNTANKYSANNHSANNHSAAAHEDASLNARIQAVLDGYRPTLFLDGGDVELLEVDAKGVAHVRMLGACIDCPISLLTMKLGIQRLLKENFSEIQSVNAITDLDISALYNRQPENPGG